MTDLAASLAGLREVRPASTCATAWAYQSMSDADATAVDAALLRGAAVTAVFSKIQQHYPDVDLSPHGLRRHAKGIRNAGRRIIADRIDRILDARLRLTRSE